MSKSGIIVIIIFFTALLSCGEELFDAAKDAAEGGRVAVALVEDSGKASVLATNGTYSKILKVYDWAPAAADQVFMDERGTIFTTSAMTIYAYTGSGWMSSSVGAVTPQGFAMRDGTAITLAANRVYRYDRDSATPWPVLRDYTAYATFTRIFSASDRSGVFLVDGSKGFYRLDEPESMYTDVTSPSVTAPFFYDMMDEVFYAGDSSYLADSQGNEYTVPGSATCFAVISPSNIYAGGQISARLGIMRLSGAAFVSDYEFSSSGGTVRMAVLDSATLAVGISGAGMIEENGLYIYSTSSRSIRKISSLPVMALYSRR